MAGKHYDIDRLASAAKIWLTDAVKEEVAGGVDALLEMAESLPDTGVERLTAGPAAEVPAGPEPAGGGAGAGFAPVDPRMLTISELREDEPAREFEADIFYRQSPAAGEGFTIPRLLE